jgi:hypothetical protein
MSWESNELGPYRVLRRLLLSPAPLAHYRPAGEWRLCVRACASPTPYLAVEVEEP